MGIKAFDHNFWLGGDYINVLTLPDDLTVMPIIADGNKVCHSDSAKEWYIIADIKKPVTNYNDVNYYLFAHGSFIDIAPNCNINYLEVPFKWGEPITNNRLNNIKYIPIWGSVPTGKYYEDGQKELKEQYKLIKIVTPPSGSFDNVYQFNDYSCFEIEDFGTNIIELIKAIECYTGMKY